MPYPQNNAPGSAKQQNLNYNAISGKEFAFHNELDKAGAAVSCSHRG